MARRQSSTDGVGTLNQRLSVAQGMDEETAKETLRGIRVDISEFEHELLDAYVRDLRSRGVRVTKKEAVRKAIRDAYERDYRERALAVLEAKGKL